eukprot:SAG31_NODE_4549_length_3146_cov_1.492944_1_plen_248_part_00
MASEQVQWPGGLDPAMLDSLVDFVTKEEGKTAQEASELRQFFVENPAVLLGLVAGGAGSDSDDEGGGAGGLSWVPGKEWLLSTPVDLARDEEVLAELQTKFVRSYPGVGSTYKRKMEWADKIKRDNDPSEDMDLAFDQVARQFPHDVEDVLSKIRFESCPVEQLAVHIVVDRASLAKLEFSDEAASEFLGTKALHAFHLPGAPRKPKKGGVQAHIIAWKKWRAGQKESGTCSNIGKYKPADPSYNRR